MPSIRPYSDPTDLNTGYYAFTASRVAAVVECSKCLAWKYDVLVSPDLDGDPSQRARMCRWYVGIANADEL